MAEIHTFKNKRGANIEIGEFRPNTYNDWCGCTIDIHISVYSDDFKRKFSFWLLDYDTGWDGESFMTGTTSRWWNRSGTSSTMLTVKGSIPSGGRICI